VLTVEQREEFDRSGIIRLRGAIAPKHVKEMCDWVWTAVERRTKVRRDAPRTWKAQRVMGTQALPKAATFDQIASPEVCDALDNLFGSGGWQRPDRWASMLVTLPESSERWDVPHNIWHLDFPASSRSHGLFAVRLFTCLAKLPRGGGGTVFVAGSHRLVQALVGKDGVVRLRSADARKALIRSHHWIKALCSFDERVDRVRQFMKEGTVIDLDEVRVVEMTGEPGDVLMTHPMLLHAPATNCTKDPRLVLSSTVYRTGVNASESYNQPNN
jgi:hypothetical protein